MDNNKGLSTGALVGAAILALFVLAGAAIVAAFPATGSAILTRATTPAFYTAKGTIAENPSSQPIEITIVQGEQNDVIVKPAVIKIPAGSSIIVHNMSSQAQVMTTSGGCHGQAGLSSNWGVTRIEPGDSSKLGFDQSGTYTFYMQSDPGVQLIVYVGER